MRAVVGSTTYAAPEILVHRVGDGGKKYTAACDLWSLGVVIANRQVSCLKSSSSVCLAISQRIRGCKGGSNKLKGRGRKASRMTRFAKNSENASLPPSSGMLPSPAILVRVFSC